MNLVENRKNLLLKLCSYFEQFPDVWGVFLGGSLAIGNADEFSDIDFRVVVKSGANKETILRALTALSDIIFVETFAQNYAVIHFDCFIKVDIFIYYKAEMTPSVWLKNIRVLKDDGFLEKLKTDSQQCHCEPSQEEFNSFLMKFYAYIHELYRRNKRNEENYVEQCENFLKNILCAFWYMEEGEQPNTISDWSKYEGVRSKLTQTQQAWLKRYTPVCDTKDFLENLSLTALSALIKISQRYQLEFDKEKYRKVMEKIEC